MSQETNSDKPCGHAKALFNNGDMLGCLDALRRLTRTEETVSGGDTASVVTLLSRANQMLFARALTQSGQPDAARAISMSLLDSVGDSEERGELLCLIGRTWKDQWEQTQSPSDLEEAIKNYRTALDISPSSYYAAINCATLALIAGRNEEAETLAQITLDLTADQNDPWAVASRAEAHALRGNTGQALFDYQAYASSGVPLRDLCTTRKQARKIAAATCHSADSFDAAFNLGVIVVFSGHRVDEEDRPDTRLPPEALSAVAEALDRRLEDLNAQFGYCSAASGADLLFIEAMLKRGAEIYVTLSSPEEEFLKASVTAGTAENWPERFRESLKQVRELEQSGRGSLSIASPHQPSDGSISYAYANQIMSGDAYQRARQLDLSLVPLVVWNEDRGDGRGGTHDFVADWRERGNLRYVRAPEIINPNHLTWERPKRLFSAPLSIKAAAPTRASLEQEIKCLLFADVRNFSKLTEDQVVQFCHHYLGRVSRIVSELHSSADHNGPLVCNTWGDAFYMVFNHIRDAGVFALHLQRAVAPNPDGEAVWAKYGLPADLSIRIALHVGPVFLFADPVIRTMSFTGRHVSFAARLEPATPPGQIYASQAFAAYAALEDVREFRCGYVGVIPGAKKFGDIRAYRVIAAAS